MKTESLQTAATKLLRPYDDDVASIYMKITSSKKMMFLTGAGISCSAGIPDFRSTEGLYNMTEGLGANLKGKDLFDISLFQSEQTIKCFSTFMSNLHTSTLSANPTKTHEFIHNQVAKNKVLRCYTQNIDGLEERLGLNTKFNNKGCSTPLQNWKSMDVVQLHGNLNELACTRCGKTTPWTDSYKEELLRGGLPACSMCLESIHQRVEKGKRLIASIGLLRPNIVLYGENHPYSEIITSGLNSDLKQKPDLLLIMGTSLKVHGVRQLVKSVSKTVHERGGLVILVNKEVIPGWNGKIDYQIQMDCDSFALRYEQFDKAGGKLIQMTNSTPKRIRIIDLLNPPSPRKRDFNAYCDDESFSVTGVHPTHPPKFVKSLLYEIPNSNNTNNHFKITSAFGKFERSILNNENFSYVGGTVAGLM